MDYKALIIKVIEQGNYRLADMEQRIDRCWIEGKLTEAERDELLPLAAEHAQDRFQVDVIAKLGEHETRLYNLEWPVDQYPEWQQGQISEKGVVYRFDVTGDGELDLVRYDGGRASTSLSIGKIEGWHMLDRELNVTHDITRGSNGEYIVTPIPEPDIPEEKSENDSEISPGGDETPGSDTQE